MIISKEHNFLFVHTQKTAGSSIQKALRPYANDNPKDRISKIRSRMNLVSKDKAIYFPVHCSSQYVEKRLGADQYENMFKFGFVRNPWDRLVSSYHYILKKKSHNRHNRVKRLAGFSEYVDFEIKRNKFSQSRLLTDKNGELNVDFVGKFENLSEDFRYVCSKIGIDCDLPHMNKSSHQSYKELYDDESEEKVAKHWAHEIRLFDFTF